MNERRVDDVVVVTRADGGESRAVETAHPAILSWPCDPPAGTAPLAHRPEEAPRIAEGGGVGCPAEAQEGREARIPPRFNTPLAARGAARTGEAAGAAREDAAAAIVAIGRFGRDAADRQLADPFAASARVARIRADVARCVPALRSRELAGVLHGCALVRAREAPLVGVVCAALAQKSDQLDARRLHQNALGRLGLPHDALLPRLLARAERDARAMHAIELANVASGTLALLGPHHTPPRLLRAIAETAVLKIDQFGAEELGRLLASLTSHRLYDSRLLAAAGGALPLVIGDMSPTDFVRLSHAFASACAAKKWWEPVTLELLGGEAAARAPAFSAEQAARTLASFGRLGWDQRDTTRASDAASPTRPPAPPTSARSPPAPRAEPAAERRPRRRRRARRRGGRRAAPRRRRVRRCHRCRRPATRLDARERARPPRRAAAAAAARARARAAARSDARYHRDVGRPGAAIGRKAQARAAGVGSGAAGASSQGLSRASRVRSQIFAIAQRRFTHDLFLE